MCGIAGIEILGDPAAPPPGLSPAGLPALLKEMAERLRHRGPDGEGFHFDGAAGLAHRRLSIIDVAGGAQPLYNEDGSLAVAFNGEIYNYVELGRMLEGRGHVFKTRSDTEVIVHAFEEWGPDCVERFVGMFAFAIRDARNRSWFLARDRLGKKPLFWRRDAGLFAFASEIKALLAIPGFSREIDREALFHYATFQYVPHPFTIFRGIRRLPPAHLLVVREGEPEQPRRYWNPPVEADPSISPGEARARIEALLLEAVALRLRSDVPLGAFLSGGIDSTIVVGLMSRLTPSRVKTFSIGFPDADYDETPFAREAARAFDTDHEEFVVGAEAAELLPALVRAYDEPFADSSALPTWRLAKMTASRVKVALSGDGGDEAFYGYGRYGAARLGGAIDGLPGFVRGLLAWAGRRLPESLDQRRSLRRWRRFLVHLPERPLERYLSWISIFRAADKALLFSPDFLSGLSEEADAAYWLARETPPSGPSRAKEAATADLFTYLPCDLLTKVDIASMAHGLEVRSPFLDHRVVEFALRLPPSYSLGLARGKKILRRTFRALLPPAIRARGKMGFGVPVSRWFRGRLRSVLEETLRRPFAHGFFNRGYVDRLVDEHLAGRRDHGAKLWSLVFFERWHDAFVKGAPAGDASRPFEPSTP